MKQFHTLHWRHTIRLLCVGAVMYLAAGSMALASPIGENTHKVRSSVHKGVPVMMLSLPGRGMLLSAPGEVSTVVIESATGSICSAYLARTDAAGVLEVPVARTKRCHSPRIVVHR